MGDSSILYYDHNDSSARSHGLLEVAKLVNSSRHIGLLDNNTPGRVLGSSL